MALLRGPKIQMKKPFIYTLLFREETKQRTNESFLPFFNWGISFVLIVRSKRLELTGCGLRHLVRNSKQFQNLTDFHVYFLLLVELLLKMFVYILMSQIVKSFMDQDPDRRSRSYCRVHVAKNCILHGQSMFKKE